MKLSEVQMQKAILWEEAKGKLRAMVTVDGFKRLAEPRSLEAARDHDKAWEKLNQEIEVFIKYIENEGLCE